MNHIVRNKRFLKSLICFSCLFVLNDCSKPAAPVISSSLERSAAGGASKKVTEGNRLLMESLQKPTAPFHISYKAQENINSKYPMDKTAKPEVGPVDLEADLSPDEMSLINASGTKKTERKAKKGDEGNWAFAQLELLGPIMKTGMVLAIGQAVARPSGSDNVGSMSADKYDFDSTTATGAQKMGIDMARSMLTNIQTTKGTVWIDKGSGRMVKFYIDADYADKNNNTWKEHYEGEITPK